MKPVPAARADRLAEAASGAELDAVLIGDMVRPGDSTPDAMADVSWLTGYRGTSGLVVVAPEGRWFVTDFRYLEMAEATVPSSFEIVDGTADLTKTVAGLLSGFATVGVDESRISVENHRKLTEAISEGVTLTAAQGLVEGLRRVKDEAEIEAIAAASALTDGVYAWLEERGFEGRSERDVALAAEGRMRELGAEDPSFPSIVAAGPNGSLIHAVPGERAIRRDEYIVIDMGAIVDGYCSDCTRTLVEGDPATAHREAYEVVLAAQEAALSEIKAGASGRELDAVAREVITDAGYGELFGHGLGHGVGLEVHEPPRLSKRSDDILQAGEVVTVEPGVYLPGEFGVRIEDLVVVTEDGHRNLSTRPK